MLKLLAALAFMGPMLVIAQSNDTEELSYLDKKVLSMSECTDSNVYVYFHEEYVETHSMDHLQAAIKASVNCEIEGITVSYPKKAAKDTTTEVALVKRSKELTSIFNAHYGQQSLNFEKTFPVEGTYLSERAVARISFEFGSSASSVTS